MFVVHSLSVGPLQANCHIVVCEESKEAVIIDPGDEGSRIINTIDELGVEPVMILLTHGHGDHIGAVADIKNQYGIPIWMHKHETHMLLDPAANLSVFLGVEIISPPADFTFTEEDTLTFSGHDVQVFETEGHSPMGCCFLFDNHLISGDALFKGSIGRTDFPGGSHEILIKRIKEKLFTLPDDTIVYPGHGPKTSIGYEKKHNPFLV
jgi:glyoxylase-like metal-dependent hydrolase (beta-lactamase superfamily II)